MKRHNSVIFSFELVVYDKKILTRVLPSECFPTVLVKGQSRCETQTVSFRREPFCLLRKWCTSRRGGERFNHRRQWQPSLYHRKVRTRGHTINRIKGTLLHLQLLQVSRNPVGESKSRVLPLSLMSEITLTLLVGFCFYFHSVLVPPTSRLQTPSLLSRIDRSLPQRSRSPFGDVENWNSLRRNRSSPVPRGVV